jgi:prolycopene isomerase
MLTLPPRLDQHAFNDDETSPAYSQYDTIVVGAGLGGLSAANYLARAGQKVLLCDRNPEPGGMATTLHHEGYSFNHCPYFLWEAYPGGFAYQIFQDLGIFDRLPLVAINPLWRVVFPDEAFDIPVNQSDYIKMLTARFPDEAEGIKKLFASLHTLLEEWHNSPYPDLSEIPAGSLMAELQPLTWAQYLDKFIGDNQLLRSVISSCWLNWGLPPGQVSALMAGIITGVGHQGVFNIKGGPGVLSNALAGTFLKAGGELLLNTAIKRIRVEQGRATGVELAGGRFVAASTVISNAPPTHTFNELVDREHVPAAYRNRLNSLMPSMSAFQIYLGLDMDLTKVPGLAVETRYLSSHDQNEVFHGALSVDGDKAFTIFSNSLRDPSAAPPGKHCLKIMGPGPYKRRGLDWDRDKEELAARLIKGAEKIIPNLSQHIISQVIGTPWDMNRLTNAPMGAIFGWGNTPDQVGPGRTNRVTPIENLYLAGAWTGPFAGMDVAMLSGRTTARLVLSKAALKA